MLINPKSNQIFEETNINEKSSKKPISKKGNRTKKTYPDFIEEFGEFLKNLNYKSIIRNKQASDKFCKDLSILIGINFLNLVNFSQLTIEHIKIYEKFLLSRISKEEISLQSAYTYLKNLKLFCNFLHNKKIIHFKYVIPKHLTAKVKRLNQYINSELISQFLMSILSEGSDKKYRTLAIVSLILETGCRPIELSNLKISDVSLSERTIILFCNKSGQRKLSLRKEVINFLKLYLETRFMYNPKSDYFFLTTYGDPVTSKYISGLINFANKKAFKEVKINARSLRHTFVTNAFENRNDLDTVSKSVGHKHWVSTLHYLHRSKDRLIQNTLKYNPLNQI